MRIGLYRASVPFRYPFRIFFLSTAVSGVLLVPVWLYALLGDGALRLAPHWHQHEMLGALVNSAIAGFLLTAVCAWTGTRPVSGGSLLALWLLWLGGRLVMLFGVAPTLGIVIDLAFLPAVALLAARPIIATRQWRQLPVLAALFSLWLCDLAFHLSSDAHWLRVAILLTCVLILLVGGRITPAFSSSWLQRQDPGKHASTVITYAWLEGLTFITALSLVVAEVSRSLPEALTAALAFVASLTATGRLFLWRGWRVRNEPLLLILHGGVLWVCIAFFLRGLAALGFISDIVWLHAMGAGAFGTMILGVMARVALGHSGRQLVLPKGIALAFLLVVSAGVLRVAAGLGWFDWAVGIYAASLCWTAAFLLFLWQYAPILVSPRIDGKEG